MDFKERWTPVYEVLLYSFSLRRIKAGKVAGSLVICWGRYFQETLFNNPRHKGLFSYFLSTHREFQMIRLFEESFQHSFEHFFRIFDTFRRKIVCYTAVRVVTQRSSPLTGEERCVTTSD